MKQVKRILALLLVLVMVTASIPFTVSFAETPQQLETELAKYEKELAQLKTNNNIIYVSGDNVNVWQTDPKFIVMVSDLAHPFNLSYSHGYYIKNISKKSADKYYKLDAWQGYLQVLDVPEQYCWTAGGSFPVKTCNLLSSDMSKKISSLETKIEDTKLKLLCVQGKLSVEIKSLKAMKYDSTSSYILGDSPWNDTFYFDKGYKLYNGYKINKQNEFCFGFNITTPRKDVKLDGYTNMKDFLSWKSSDPSVAVAKNSFRSYSEKTSKYQGEAYITIKKAGKCTITGQLYGSSQKVKIEVTVVENCKSITITPKTVELDKGDTVDLSYTVKPKGALTGNIKWISSDTSVATVSSKGKVKAISKGTAYIYVYNKKTGFVSSSCKVKVNSDTSFIPNNVNSKARAIKALKACDTVTKPSVGYFYDNVSETDEYIYTRFDTYKVSGYHVSRYSPIYKAIKELYACDNNERKVYDEITAEEFFVLKDGKIMQKVEDTYSSYYVFVENYFEDNDELKQWYNDYISEY